MTAARKRTRRQLTGWILAPLLAVAGAPCAMAVINPNFTPIHVVEQAALIVEVEFRGAKDGKAAAAVKRTVKGTMADKTIHFDLSTSALREQARSVEKLLNDLGNLRAILFGGEFSDVQDAGANPQPEPENNEAGGAQQKTLLHMNGLWLVFYKGTAGSYELDAIDPGLLTTWNGGTDMLIRAVDYIVGDPGSAVLPVVEGVNWAGRKQFAKLDGRVGAAMPVDLAGDGKHRLHVACEAGDRLFAYDGESGNLADMTAATKLAARSRVATWGDFNADGRMDLASWDGQVVTIHTQSADGTFQGEPAALKSLPKDGCRSLSVVDCGKPGRPGVLIGTKTAPAIWTPGEADGLKEIVGEFAGAGLGAPGPCLVADLDGDARPDILQLFEKGSLVYRGKAPGRFENAVKADIALGKGAGSAFLGDYDADSRFDVFTVASDDASRLWVNRGNLAYADVSQSTGELTYKGNSQAIGGMTGDLNNDGRQDMFFIYPDMGPQLYFNRGFRSFGFCNGLDPSIGGLLPQAGEGQQAGCLADVNGDGLQDMIVILKNGEAWAFYMDLRDGSFLSLRGAMSARSAYAGPLTVTGWQANRCLGAWNVTPGLTEALVGVAEAGPVTLKWQLPGDGMQSKEAIVESKSVRIVIGQ